jgi:hypothetical protein
METGLQTQSQTLQVLLETPNYKALTIAEKEILTACLEPNIKSFSDNDFRNNMLALIGKTHLNLGWPLDKNQLELTIDELCSDLKKYNSTLSFQEINIAFKNGYKKQYGEFYGLNNATYFAWVNAYAYSVNRSNAKKAIQAAAEKEKVKPVISPEEKEYIIEAGALSCFEHYRKTQIIYDLGNVTYDYLNSKELIPFTDEVKKEIYQSCKARLIDEQKSKLTDPANIGKHQGIKSAIKEIEENKYLPAIAESKRVALKMYFDQLIQMEIELKDELNN